MAEENEDVTWADPDPFRQLDEKNPKKNIGVANPYVLASLILKTNIKWNRVNAFETLMAAFAQHGSKSFADIFNPNSSILFSHAKITALLTGAGAGAPTGDIAVKYGPIIPSANYPPPSAPAGSQPPTPLPFKKITFNNIKDIVDDSMQGTCLDCYFIAALYAKAWCSYPIFPPVPPSCANGSDISFYKKVDTIPPSTQKITKCATPRFPVDLHDQPVCAQMTTEWELYTALYEKAYALFCGLRKSVLPGATDTDPEISSFPQGDPLLSLFHLTSLVWDFTRNNNLNQPSAFLTTDLSQFGFGSSYLAMNKNLSATVGSSRKTLNPMVAWTYDARPACSSTWFGANNPYGNDLIVPSHSYSILGSVRLRDSSGTDRDYIVLRNPWGANCTGDPSGCIQPYLAAGLFTPVAGISFDLGRKPNGITTDGIFGLRSEVFDCCFKGFGWAPFKVA
jgi:hypothetical protein